MAELVCGFLMPHDPLISAITMAAPPSKRDACLGAFEEITRRIRAAEVDTVIVIGDDHATVNGPSCMPTAMIAVGDIVGPKETWLGMPRAKVENNEALARHILDFGLKRGVDWSVSKTLLADHSIMIPVHYAVRPIEGLRTIPVYINSGMDPVIPSRRAYDIGRLIGDAVAAWPGSERVAIYGTGGISHWPGTAQMGRINEDWDRMVMALVESGDVNALLALSDEDILRDGGNGGLEIKNFLCAIGAMRDVRGETIAYEAVPEWVSGLGFMELKRAH
ncbi:protocatechuate 3,4-dioxygenase [Nevskia ramosa]|uniref:DODA-type extradiol aromatic ring-opening family dioxygenase n=1 Tax=Nevskia ramosa TaxID=64002 RepID=UPI003D0F3D59